MDGSSIVALILGLTATFASAGSAIFIARRYKKLGGDTAQQQVNSVYRELSDGLDRRLKMRDQELGDCLQKVNDFLRDAEVAAEEQKRKEKAHEVEQRSWRKERLQFKQEIDDLRDQVRELRREVQESA